MNGTITYQVADNYFVKNTVKDEPIHAVKIANADDLTTYFGAAATMGEKGKPTPIDFGKQYAIGLIAPSTNKQSTLEIRTLKKEKDSIVLTYHVTEGEEQSYVIRPFVLLIVDKSNQGALILREERDE